MGEHAPLFFLCRQIRERRGRRSFDRARGWSDMDDSLNVERIRGLTPPARQLFVYDEPILAELSAIEQKCRAVHQGPHQVLGRFGP